MDGCSLPYPLLPKRSSREESKAAEAGLERFLSLRYKQGYLNLPPAADLQRELAGIRSARGEYLTAAEAATGIGRDAERVTRAGIFDLLDRHRYLGGDYWRPILEDAIWNAMDGVDVAEIDDSSVPNEVRDRIYAPTTDYMKGQIGLYNTYQKLVVIPVDFAQFPRNPAVNVPAVRSFFFGPIGTDTLGSYMAANSFFRYVLEEGWISSTVRLPSSPAPDQLSGSDVLVKAALEGSNVDWSRFAGPGGVITQDRATVVIVAPFGGTGATRRHDVTFNWAGLTLRYQGQICFFDCKAASDPAFAVEPIAYNVGTAIHELGHTLFGLPDRYGTSQDHYGHDYVGAYDMMSNDGSKKFYNAHDRMKIGWIEPKIIHLGHNPRRVYKLKASEVFSSGIVIIYSDISPDEYWVVENRSSAADVWGADSGLPSSGLCVWWVNAVDDVVILINQHHAGDKPLRQPQPELPADPLFTGAVREAFLFPEWESGAVFLRKIGLVGSFATFEA